MLKEKQILRFLPSETDTLVTKKSIYDGAVNKKELLIKNENILRDRDKLKGKSRHLWFPRQSLSGRFTTHLVQFLCNVKKELMKKVDFTLFITAKMLFTFKMFTVIKKQRTLSHMFQKLEKVLLNDKCERLLP